MRARCKYRLIIFLSLLLIAIAIGVGCEPLVYDSHSDTDPPAQTTSTSTNNTGTVTNGTGDVIDPNQVTSLGYCREPVMSWPVTQPNVQAVVSGGRVIFEGYNSHAWTPAFGEKQVNANSFVGYQKEDGTYHMQTWEYVPKGRNERGTDFGSFRPSSGQTVYFMVSGLCRDGSQRNVEERSNISSVIWP